MYTVDINCDMGESFGRYVIGNDQDIIKYISSANIACGLHAGDPAIMDETVKLAIKHHVKIGAHPGLPDIHGFGRRVMNITPTEAYQWITYQIGALQSFVKINGGKLHHVKPHGALYNMAAKDKAIAVAIAEAMFQIDPTLTLYGPSNSELTKAGEKIGLTVKHEVFVDRTYQDDGTLTPRTEKNALLTNKEEAINQALMMIKKQKVISVNGIGIPIKIDTLCIHGDGPYALDFASTLYQHLKTEGIQLNK
ncbi:5-oxoprolinase subunit PxpA [Aquibacillus halophilus]|uniref:5-oxoprolinase subunit A n=1 Tax=Aquibacillus halophilus TaxID=930132 RepID=A0A6A8D9J4_9BACI|nr:5-oxoprolinase subunit PxpA [Aquibacillus halophilus]MRH41940.1 5-oxoprolinase subunit PxpA [Aquibacillus halophilus]